jgi:hypothetical protein
MAKKDEIAVLVAKLNEGRFRTFDDLARLVQHGRALSLSLDFNPSTFLHPSKPHHSRASAERGGQHRADQGGSLAA